jgi:NAD(P)-dependent dehydrogenase (short-subunit alcohol dehydrogenase family)
MPAKGAGAPEWARRSGKSNPGWRRGAGLGGIGFVAAVVCAAFAFPGSSATFARSPDASMADARVDEASIQGDVILITGSTSGLGRELAVRLAATGAHVIVHGRSAERGMDVVREIQRTGRGSASFHAADLASLDQVRELARTILANYDRLDVLVNNAGIGSARDGRQVSEDGHELVFQVNYLSHFLLTHELLPLVVGSQPSRIVNVASAAQSPIDFDDVMLEEDGAIARAYGQSKLAQIMHAFDLARELEGTKVVVNALHPATFMDTEMVRRAGVEPRSTVEEGADAVMQLVTGDVGTGRYFNGLEQARAHHQAYDEAARARLRRLSRELVGLDPG